jgi:hypothetical protein
MQTRCYSICRRCASVYPEGRRCPACEGDAEAARVVAEATAHAVEATRHQPIRPMRHGAMLVTGIVAVSLIAGLGVIALAFV